MATILIVDDDVDIVNLFQIFLSREGYNVITASEGTVCLNKLEQVHPDLILLDVMMEPMDGWETLAAIKKNPQTTDIPVIMITGKPLMKDEREKYGTLFSEYMLKPIRRATLIDMARETLNHQRG